jgi:hypothetical protein
VDDLIGANGLDPRCNCVTIVEEFLKREPVVVRALVVCSEACYLGDNATMVHTCDNVSYEAHFSSQRAGVPLDKVALSRWGQVNACAPRIFKVVDRLHVVSTGCVVVFGSQAPRTGQCRGD